MSVGGCRFHKDQEDGLPAAVSEQRFMAGQLQHFCRADLILTPFEHQNAARFQNPETLPETGLQILLPSLPVQFSVFLGQPGRFPGVNQVRRVEHDKAKRPVTERHGPEVSDDIRLDFQSAPVAKRVCFLPAVHEHHVRMAAVKPEHAGAAAGIKHRLHSPSFLGSQLTANPSLMQGLQTTGTGLIFL